MRTSKRNAEIRAARASGEPLAAIARRHGITYQRVQQIISGKPRIRRPLIDRTPRTGRFLARFHVNAPDGREQITKLERDTAARGTKLTFYLVAEPDLCDFYEVAR